MYRVMIIDDEYFVRMSILNRIDWAGLGLMVVSQAENGQDALGQLAEALPDIALVDVRMPVMGGLEFIELARKQRPDLACIILSGYSDFAYAQSAIKLSVDDYLLKPVETDELRNAIVRIIQKLDGVPGSHPRHQIPVVHQSRAVQPAPQESFSSLSQSLLELEGSRSLSTGERVQLYIEKHLADDLRIETIAKAFFLSASYLAQLFKSETGTPISSYIENRRIEHSKALLIQLRLSITDIAAQVGYQDPAYFSRVFKRCTGITPKKYQSTYSIKP